MKYPLIFLLGLVFGLALYGIFITPKIETKTEIVEIRTTDTLYFYQRDTIRIKEVKHEYIRDTIFKEPFIPVINRFSADFNHLYGNISFQGEVLGEVLKTSMLTDLRIPTVINTIDRTKTITNTINPNGLYMGGGYPAYFGISYINNKMLIDVHYSFETGSTVGLKRKIF